MTRADIIEAGAKAIEKALDEAPGGHHASVCRFVAAAILDAITKGMGLKLMGREPTDRALAAGLSKQFADGFEVIPEVEIAYAMWDAAPWMPGGEK